MRTAAILLLLTSAAPGLSKCSAQTPPQNAGAQKQTTTAPGTKPNTQTDAKTDTRLVDGAQAIEKKDYPRGVALITDYLKDHPEDSAAHFQLAYAYGSMKRGSEAVPEYRRAIELNPGFAAAHLNLGLLLLEQGDAVSAARSFQSAADLMPDQANPRFLAGVALERSGNLPGAITQYATAGSLDAKNYDIFFRWGMALLRAGRPADSEQRLRQAVALKPDSDAAHLALANALLAEKKPDGAAAELTEHLKNNPNDVDARGQLASALYDLGKPAEALAELDRADSSAGPSLEREKLRASILISQEQWDAAIRALTFAVNAAPQDANLHAELGRILLQKRDFPAAERELQRALAIDSTMTVALRNLVSTVYLAGDYPGALKLLDELAQREPPTPIVLFVRATCYDKLQRKAEAVEAYQKFLAADKGQSDKEEFQAQERMKLLQRELSKK